MKRKNIDSIFWIFVLILTLGCGGESPPSPHSSFVKEPLTQDPKVQFNLDELQKLLSESSLSSSPLDPNSCTPPRMGDFDNSGIIDLDDIYFVIDCFGAGSSDACQAADIIPCGGGNGVIDLDDILAVLMLYNGDLPCGPICPDGDDLILDPKLIYSTPSVGFSDGVAFAPEGGKLYVASRSNGVVEVDIQNPEDPFISATSGLNMGALGVAVSEKVLITGGSSNAVSVLDRRQFGTLNENWVSFGFAAQGIAIRGDIAAIATGLSGLKILDVSSPANPHVLFSLSMFARGVAISPDGNFAYVAAGGGANGGLKVIDLRQSSPQIVAEISQPEGANSNEIILNEAGTWAYVAESGDGFSIYDIRNPAQPVRVGTHEGLFGTRGANNLALSGNRLVVSGADGAPAAHIFDVTDPVHPIHLGSHPSLITDMVAKEGYVYCSVLSGGIRVMSITDPTQPKTVAQLYSQYALYSSSATNGEVFLSGGNIGQISVWNVSNTEAPYLYGNIPITGQDILIRQNLAYIASGSAGFKIVDISNPENPEILSTISMFARGVTVTTDGRYAYVAAGKVSGYGRVNVVDIFDPNNPVLRASVATGLNGIASKIDLNESETKVYVADFGSGLQILDIRDPLNPQLLGEGLGFSTATQQVTVMGDNIVLVANVGNGSTWSVVDVSNPLDPIEISSLPSMIQGRMEIVDQYALIPAGVFGLKIYDLSNPRAPIKAFELSPPGDQYTLTHLDGLVYIGSAYSPLQIVDLYR